MSVSDEAPIVHQYRAGDREQLFQFIREAFSPDDSARLLTVLGSNAKSATSVGFQVKNNDASAAHSGTANCTAVHH